MNSFMLVRHGHVVAEGWWAPYDAKTPHMFYSLSKSFTSTAVGLAVAEGKLSLDDQVLKFFPEDAPADPSANLRAMRVRDLLRMSAGHQTEAALWAWSTAAPTPTERLTKLFLAHPVPFKPGTHFMYNSPATYMQSAIVQKVTGTTVLDYLRPRLFDPLGFENPTWLTSPQGVTTGAFGLMGRTEEIARFGQLYLQKGVWNGRQLIPAAWIAEATAMQTSNGSAPTSDWDQGYGYQFWRSRHGYRGDGAFGQYMLILPEQDAVVAITSGVRNMQSVMDLVWNKLLPAMSAGALPEDASSAARVAREARGAQSGDASRGAGRPRLQRGFRGDGTSCPRMIAASGRSRSTSRRLRQRCSCAKPRVRAARHWELARGCGASRGFTNGIEQLLSVAPEPRGRGERCVDGGQRLHSETRCAANAVLLDAHLPLHRRAPGSRLRAQRVVRGYEAAATRRKSCRAPVIAFGAKQGSARHPERGAATGPATAITSKRHTPGPRQRLPCR